MRYRVCVLMYAWGDSTPKLHESLACSYDSAHRQRDWWSQHGHCTWVEPAFIHHNRRAQ